MPAIFRVQHLADDGETHSEWFYDVMSAQARRVELREQGYRPSKTNRYDIGLKKADFIAFLNAYERGEAETVG